ncbi:MAG: hypothetical protein CMJ56_01140 [Planctomycetaceae bacterium]|nr:hypothetical protein [Planctomycetaceae bacterium]
MHGCYIETSTIRKGGQHVGSRGLLQIILFTIEGFLKVVLTICRIYYFVGWVRTFIPDFYRIIYGMNQNDIAIHFQ